MSAKAASVAEEGTAADDSRSGRSFSRLGLIAALLWLLALTAVPYALSQRNVIYIDESALAYMAWAGQVTGQPMYQLGHENKTPGLLWLYRAMGAYDEATMGRARLAVGFLVFLTAAVLLWLVGQAISCRAGVLAASIYVLALVFLTGCRALTEPAMVLGTTLGFCLLYFGLRSARSYLFLLAGLAFALAFIFKQVAVLDLAAALLVILLWPRSAPWRLRWSRLGAVLLGFASPIVLMGLYLWLSGQWAEFYQASVMALLHPPSATVVSLGHRFDRWMFFWRQLFPAQQGVWLSVMLAYGLLWRKQMSTLGLAAGIWLAFTVLAYVWPGTMYDHQAVQYLPPLAVLCGAGLATVWERFGGWRSWWRAAAVLLLLIIALGPLADAAQQRVQRNLEQWAEETPTADARVGAWIAAVTRPSERIYVVGNGIPLYLHAERLAPIRWVYSWQITEALRPTAVRELQAARPAVIVLTFGYTPETAQLMAAVRSTVISQGYCQIEGPLPGDYQVFLREDLLPRLDQAPAPPSP